MMNRRGCSRMKNRENLLRNAKYATRLHSKKIEKAVDNLRSLFSTLNVFFCEEWDDEKLKNDILSQLTEGMANETLDSQESKIKYKVAWMLKNLLTGEEVETEQESGWDEEQQEETEKTTSEPDKTTSSEQPRQESVEKIASEQDKTSVFDETASSEQEKEEVIGHDETIEGENGQKNGVEELEETAKEKEKMKEPNEMEGTVHGMEKTALEMNETAVEPEQPTLTALEMSIHVNQTLEKVITELEESIICLGTPARPPIEVVTLEDTPLKTSVRPKRMHFFERRKTTSMEISSPQSPWSAHF